MNWDQIEGKWKQVTGSVKARWGKLTDDDLQVIAGHKDQLVGRIQERYGIRKEKAEQQVEEESEPRRGERVPARQSREAGQLTSSPACAGATSGLQHRPWPAAVPDARLRERWHEPLSQ